MRNPRSDPIKGDVLEHQSGEKRVVIAHMPEMAMVRYRDGSEATECSETQWQKWAEQTSIVDFGD